MGQDHEDAHADGIDESDPPVGALPDYAKIKVIFTDLDGTFFPGAFEDGPHEERRGLRRNLGAAGVLEGSRGVPVIPATGNNVALAQAKFVDPKSGALLRDLRGTAGIYCNGSLVKGANGKEILVKSLGDCRHHSEGSAGSGKNVLEALVECWMRDAALGDGMPGIVGRCCVAGLGKDCILFLEALAEPGGGGGDIAHGTGEAFASHMEVKGDFIRAEEFIQRAGEVLSLIMLLPKGDKESETADKLALQAWLQRSALLLFDGDPGVAAEKLSTGCGDSFGYSVVCKHVHVPGIGPEIDISPAGVNKGSAIVDFLEKEFPGAVVANDEIAVFGDAGNDVELFGMRRNAAGNCLTPLFEGTSLESSTYGGYRPATRVAMPWANDALLKQDATVIARAHVVLEKIAGDKGAAPGAGPAPA